MAASDGAERPRVAFDCSSVVRAHVERACQNPFYSQLREEVTRQACAVYEAKAKARGRVGSPPCIVDGGPTGTSFFPFANGQSAETSRALARHAPECVTLIGGTGFFGKFVAEQYLHRGISVTVLARDAAKAKAIFVPIASGEREERVMASQGYVRLPGHTEAVPVDEGGVPPEEQGSRKVLRYTYRPAVVVSRAPPSAPAAQMAVAGASTTPQGRSVTLEIVEGDMNSSEDVEFAVRRASMVYFLAPAQEDRQDAEAPREKRWWFGFRPAPGTPSPSSSSAPDASAAAPATSSSSSGASTSSYSGMEVGSTSTYGGFLRVFDACRRVDAHFVSLTPLWVHGSRLSPVYWYRRLVTHPRGYVSAVRYQEANLLERGGAPSPRCYFGTEVDDELEPPPAWRYWLSILRSTKLPADLEAIPRSPVRFSLFRLSDIVYPAFNTRMVAVKNNRIDNALHVQNIDTGDLDARLLANVLTKTVSLCNSVVESRIDVGGRLRGDVDMRDTAAVLEMFSRFRNEA